jgi:predicted transcriptional regulator
MKKKIAQRKLIVGVRNLKEMGQDFISVWKRAEKGLPIDSTPHLYFESIMDLWKKLTPRRMEMVYFLHQHGSMSIRRLAKLLNRDYKDVHSDVNALLPVDLVKKEDDGLISAPWDSIEINLSDAAAA